MIFDTNGEARGTKSMCKRPALMETHSSLCFPASSTASQVFTPDSTGCYKTFLLHNPSTPFLCAWILAVLVYETLIHSQFLFRDQITSLGSLGDAFILKTSVRRQSLKPEDEILENQQVLQETGEMLVARRAYSYSYQLSYSGHLFTPFSKHCSSAVDALMLL